jgi:nucleobase:cation symporter-1, NCS1 family
MTSARTTVEARSFEFVPPTERYGTLSDQRRFWFMTNASLLTVLTGAIGPSAGLGLGWTLVAAVTGGAVGTVFQALHAAQGPIMGLPQMIQSRVQFGSRGALVPLLAAVLSCLGFALFLVQAGGSALSAVTPVESSPAQVFVGGGALVVAVVGHRLLMRLERHLTVVMCACLLALSVALLLVAPWPDLGARTWAGSGPAFLAQSGASAMIQLGIAVLVSDYTRYLPRSTRGRDLTAAVFGGTLVSGLWLTAVGAVAASSAPGADVVAALRELGDDGGFPLGTLTLVVSVPAALLAAATGLYSAAVSFLSGLESFRPVRSTRALRTAVLAVMGAATLVVGLLLPSDTVAGFAGFLTLMGYVLVPWTAINLADFYLVRRGVYAISDILRPDGGRYGRWAWRGLLAYALGLVAMAPFAVLPWWTGPAAATLGGADMAFLCGALASAGCYLLLMRDFDQASYVAAVSKAPMSTIGGALEARPAVS